MLTRCPQPSCNHEFEYFSSDSRTVENCPRCAQVLTCKPLEILKKIDSAYERRRESGLLCGGPQSSASGNPPRFSVAAEDVRSLWNVGSIFRTSDGAGFSQIYLCGITGCPPRKEITKTSLGAENTVSWQYCRGVLEIIPALKENGVLIVGLESTPDSVALSDALDDSGKIAGPLCIIVGNEVTGLSAETLSVCDLVCHLPMRGTKESLNVAVAFGIAAYQITEKLCGENPHSTRCQNQLTMGGINRELELIQKRHSQ